MSDHDRLEPTAVEVCEVRWIEPWWKCGDVQVRRYRRTRDALAHVARLRARGVTEVGAYVAPVGTWQPIDDGSTR